MRVTVYHNPACGNSRGAVTLLQEYDVELEVVDYLKTPPAEAVLRDLMARFDGPLFALVRSKEPEFAATGLHPDSGADEILATLLAIPRLMQRPLVDLGDRVIVARPPDVLKTLFD